MLILLKCEKCKYEYSVSEMELKDFGEYHRFCFFCGGKMEVNNLEEIVEDELIKEINKNIDIYFRDLGIEYTLEMTERNKTGIGKLYRIELEKRGFKLKKELR